MRYSGGLEREGRLIENARVGEDVHLLRFEVEETLPHSLPGQFFMVRPSRWERDPFLLRPFAVVDQSDKTVDFLVKVVGRGTKDISVSDIGVSFRLRGPLGGRGFTPSCDSVVLVAGGIGIAPLLYAWKLHSKFVVRFIFGVPNKGWTDIVNWIKSQVSGAEVACEDGSLGVKGTAVDLLLSGQGYAEEIWACGPVPMLKAICDAFKDKIRILGSFESRMGCGIGGCHSCAIPTRSGMLKVCHDGPVFDLSEVYLDELL